MSSAFKVSFPRLGLSFPLSSIFRSLGLNHAVQRECEKAESEFPRNRLAAQ